MRHLTIYSILLLLLASAHIAYGKEPGKKGWIPPAKAAKMRGGSQLHRPGKTVPSKVAEVDDPTFREVYIPGFPADQIHTCFVHLPAQPCQVTNVRFYLVGTPLVVCHIPLSPTPYYVIPQSAIQTGIHRENLAAPAYTVFGR